MKIKEGFVLRQVCGEYMVMAVGRQTLDFKGLIKLNESGAFLWEQLKEDRTEQDLLAALTAEYAVDEELAKTDIQAFLMSLREAELLV